MEFDFPDQHVRLRLDSGWSARRVGTDGVVAHPAALAAVDPAELPTSVYVKLHRSNEQLRSAALRIMTHRAFAGGLDALPVMVGSMPAVLFKWTDGILDIESMFVATRPDIILELTFSAEPDRRSDGIYQHQDLRASLGRFFDISFLVDHATRQ